MAHWKTISEHEHWSERLNRLCKMKKFTDNFLRSLIRLLIENGAEINAKNALGSTPIMTASRNGNVESVRILLAGKADVNVRNKEGETAVRLAMEESHQEIIDLLKDQAVDG